MKRLLSRLVASTMVVASLSAVLVQPASARPRSWFLPPLTVDCVTGVGRTEAFTGAYELGPAAVLKGELTVGGSLAGTCGPESIDTLFRAPITVSNASCTQVTLTLGDTVLAKETLVMFSQEPLVLTSAEVSRGTLCSLAGVQKGSLKAQANALNKLIAQQG